MPGHKWKEQFEMLPTERDGTVFLQSKQTCVNCGVKKVATQRLGETGTTIMYSAKDSNQGSLKYIDCVVALEVAIGDFAEKFEAAKQPEKKSHHRAKLTRAQVAEIKMHLNNKRSESSLADQFNCSQANIHLISRGLTWEDVKAKEDVTPEKIVPSKLNEVGFDAGKLTLTDRGQIEAMETCQLNADRKHMIKIPEDMVKDVMEFFTLKRNRLLSELARIEETLKQLEETFKQFE